MEHRDQCLPGAETRFCFPFLVTLRDFGFGFGGRCLGQRRWNFRRSWGPHWLAACLCRGWHLSRSSFPSSLAPSLLCDGVQLGKKMRVLHAPQNKGSRPLPQLPSVKQVASGAQWDATSIPLQSPGPPKLASSTCREHRASGCIGSGQIWGTHVLQH